MVRWVDCISEQWGLGVQTMTPLSLCITELCCTVLVCILGAFSTLVPGSCSLTSGEIQRSILLWKSHACSSWLYLVTCVPMRLMTGPEDEKTCIKSKSKVMLFPESRKGIGADIPTWVTADIESHCPIKRGVLDRKLKYMLIISCHGLYKKLCNTCYLVCYWHYHS